MNTQQNNSKLTQLPVVMFLAGICCFYGGSATPAIKNRISVIPDPVLRCYVHYFICRNAIRTGRLSGNTVPQYPGTSLDHAGTRFRKSYCIPLFKPDSSSVLFLFIQDWLMQVEYTVPLSQEEMFLSLY